MTLRELLRVHNVAPSTLLDTEVGSTRVIASEVGLTVALEDRVIRIEALVPMGRPE